MNKAIKLNPFNWECIFYLGVYYSKLSMDFKKAVKCFLKAYELCQNLNICGLELVDALLSQNQEELASNLLKTALVENSNSKWACLRLGIIYLKNGQSNDSIKLFHNVIRNDPND